MKAVASREVRNPMYHPAGRSGLGMRRRVVRHCPRAIGLLGMVAACGCGARTSLDVNEITGSAPQPSRCTGSPFQCVRPPSDDPCGPNSVESAVCNESSATWQCASGARPYERATEGPAVCMPFYGTASPIRRLGGSLTRVPTDDGRCLWVADEVETDAGIVLDVAFVPDLTAPYGTCPSNAALLDGSVQSVVTVSGGADPSTVVQITGAYRMNGSTRVTYRVFRLDGGAVFGQTDLGTGIGRWDAASGRIVVGNLTSPRFPTDVDLADDSIVLGSYAYVWGCPVLTYLSRQCLLGRIDAADSVQLFVGNGQWSAGASASAAVPVFTGGPWIGSVISDVLDGGLLHVFAPEFGATLQAQHGSVPEGPWTPPASFASCDLPSADPAAFCMGPVIHTELADPTRPSERVVSYDVKTTSSTPLPTGDAYWPRIAWVSEK